MHEEWFADEERVRRAVGIIEKLVKPPNFKEVSYQFALLPHVFIFPFTMHFPHLHEYNGLYILVGGLRDLF